MKHLFKITLITILSFSILGCSDEQEAIEEQSLNLEELNSKIDTAFGAKITKIESNNYQIDFENGKIAYISLNESGKSKITGTVFGGKSYSFDNTVFDPDNAPLAFSPIEYDSTALRSPCDEHPGGEEFKVCFKREWSEFCDGLVGCLAQATNPVYIAAVIAGHCVACGEDE